MRAMQPIEGDPSPAKTSHKEHDPTQKARLAYFDQDEETLVRYVLAADPVFQAKARDIAELPPAERQAAAERKAESYAPNKAARSRVVAELLLLMAEEPWPSRGPKAALFSFANFNRTAVWEEDERRDDRGAHRVRERWESLHEGAQALALFGAGKCIGCGFNLADRNEYGASHRPSRRKHCGRCCDPRGSLSVSREANMRNAFDVLTGARHRSRASRRASRN
jgi:hypothetical protein